MIRDFWGGRGKVVCKRSFDRVTPRIVIISAMSFTVFGIVVMGGVCRVDSLVMLPMRMEARARRIRGEMVFLVSLWGLMFVWDGPVRISRIICMLYEAESVVAISVIVRAHRFTYELVMVSIMVSFE